MTSYDKNLFAHLENDDGYSNTNATEILNPFVNFNDYNNTKTLSDVLVSESIQMRGIELYYIPREYVNPDLLFGEDLQSKFTKAWKFAGYLNSYEGYEGANSFYTNFGMQVSDEVTISINPNLFKNQCDKKEPAAGDLIYFPMDNSLFEINWVQPYDPFYQVGQNSIRKITAGKFIYSGEKIKPELQRNEGINIPEFSELDLDPVRNIDQLGDIDNDQYSESNAINEEARKFVHDYVVTNGEGFITPESEDAFDDDFMNK